MEGGEDEFYYEKPYPKRFKHGRDIRVLLIFIEAVLNQAYLVLIVIAVLINLETIRRIVICRE